MARLTAARDFLRHNHKISCEIAMTRMFYGYDHGYGRPVRTLLEHLHCATPKRQNAKFAGRVGILPFVASPPRRGNGNTNAKICRNTKSHANDTGFAGDSTPTAKFGGGKNRPGRCLSRHYWQIIYCTRKHEVVVFVQIIYRTREHKAVVFVIVIDYSCERLSAQCLLYGRWRGSSIPTAVHAAARRRQRDYAKPGCLTRMPVWCSLSAICQTRQSMVETCAPQRTSGKYTTSTSSMLHPSTSCQTSQRFGAAVTV
jgi:hypothetical protein